MGARKNERLDELAKDVIKKALEAKPIGGKEVWLCKHGFIEIDRNYDPPRVRRLEDAEKTD